MASVTEYQNGYNSSYFGGSGSRSSGVIPAVGPDRAGKAVEMATLKVEPVEQLPFPAGMRVLVVDDDPSCLIILEKMLRKCNYHVTSCTRATTALQKLRENKDAYDLVISDVIMPDMDGFKLLELVGLEMDLPVIMMSANGETSAVMKGVTHGACDYLLKPVRIEELRNIWQHVLRKKKQDNKGDDAAGSIEDPGRRRDEEGDFTSSADQDTVSASKHSLNKKRKEGIQVTGSAKEEGEHTGFDEDDNDPGALKKARVVWSVELHQQFVNAVNQLGIDKAVPKKVLEMMNVSGLTRENVASHLQKYRLYLKRLSGVAPQLQSNNSGGSAAPSQSGTPDSTMGRPATSSATNTSPSSSPAYELPQEHQAPVSGGQQLRAQAMATLQASYTGSSELERRARQHLATVSQLGAGGASYDDSDIAGYTALQQFSAEHANEVVGQGGGLRGRMGGTPVLPGLEATGGSATLNQNILLLQLLHQQQLAQSGAAGTAQSLGIQPGVLQGSMGKMVGQTRGSPSARMGGAASGSGTYQGITQAQLAEVLARPGGLESLQAAALQRSQQQAPAADVHSLGSMGLHQQSGTGSHTGLSPYGPDDGHLQLPRSMPTGYAGNSSSLSPDMDVRQSWHQQAVVGLADHMNEELAISSLQENNARYQTVQAPPLSYPQDSLPSSRLAAAGPVPSIDSSAERSSTLPEGQAVMDHHVVLDQAPKLESQHSLGLAETASEDIISMFFLQVVPETAALHASRHRPCWDSETAALIDGDLNTDFDSVIVYVISLLPTTRLLRCCERGVCLRTSSSTQLPRQITTAPKLRAASFSPQGMWSASVACESTDLAVDTSSCSAMCTRTQSTWNGSSLPVYLSPPCAPLPDFPEACTYINPFPFKVL
eukprot:SM000036S13227  [mRNA]  locus=s36:14220:19539:+ [translate_table: standard]